MDPARNTPATNRAIADMFDALADSLKGATMLTLEQEHAIQRKCRDYGVAYIPGHYQPAFDLPDGWVAGWIGPIYVGVSPEGGIHS